MTDYTKTGNPPQDGRGISKQIRDEFTLIETAVNSKANINSPTFTGTPRGPTASFGSSGTQFATLDYVNGVAFGSTLPAQTGNNGKLLTTDGTNASWSENIKASVVRIVNTADPTRKLAFNVGSVSTGTTRTWTVEDNDVTVGTPGMKLISVTNASGSATVDLETTFDSTYAGYLILVNNVIMQTDNVSLHCRLKIGGSYLTSNTYSYNYENTKIGTTGTPSLVGGVTQSSIVLCETIGNAAGEHTNLRIWINNTDLTTLPKTINFNGNSHYSSTGVSLYINGFGNNSTLGALTGIRLYASTGNISSGTFRIYGYRKDVA